MSQASYTIYEDFLHVAAAEDEAPGFATKGAEGTIDTPSTRVAEVSPTETCAAARASSRNGPGASAGMSELCGK